MSTEERERHTLHGRLEHVLGTDEAATLMGYLPPVGWADVATKHDLSLLQRNITDIRSDITDIRSDIAGLRSDMSDLRAEVRAEIAAVRAEILGLRSDAATHLRTLVLAMTGSIFTTASLAFAAARLG